MIILNTQQYSKKILRGIGPIIQYLFCVSNSGLLKILSCAKINFSTKQYGYFVIFITIYTVHEAEIRFSFVKARLLSSHCFPSIIKIETRMSFFQKSHQNFSLSRKFISFST